MKRQRERDLGVETERERKKNIEVDMFSGIDRGKDTKSREREGQLMHGGRVRVFLMHRYMYCTVHICKYSPNDIRLKLWTNLSTATGVFA